MNLGLKDKTVVVTGGANGIGEGIVRSLIREEACPVVIDKDEQKMGLLAAEFGGRVSFCLCDLSDPLETKKVITTVNTSFSDIYGLVNNAGVNDGVGLNSELPEFVASLQQNLLHYFQMTQGLKEKIKNAQGSIVNISSKVSFTGQGGTSGYAASKGAINALTREWAVELAPYGVDVNCVIPAEVMTPQYERWIKTQEGGARLPAITRKINLGQRLTTTEEIADYVLFLLSTKNSHATGQLVFVDGGYTHLDDSKM